MTEHCKDLRNAVSLSPPFPSSTLQDEARRPTTFASTSSRMAMRAELASQGSMPWLAEHAYIDQRGEMHRDDRRGKVTFPRARAPREWARTFSTTFRPPSPTTTCRCPPSSPAVGAVAVVPTSPRSPCCRRRRRRLRRRVLVAQSSTRIGMKVGPRQAEDFIVCGREPSRRRRSAS